jgi:deoxyribose-phosphate aldolase
MADEIDRIVDIVAQRIKDRIGKETQQNQCAQEGCSANREQCTGCGHSVRRRPEDAKKILQIGAVRLSSAPNVGQVRNDLAPYIDHTLLKANASKDELKKLCEEARQYGFASVCINPANVRYCSSLLQGTKVMVVAVVGFPLGATTSEAKAFEAREAIRQGAKEIDMVANIGALKSGDYRTVLDDVQKVVSASLPHKVKVIIETGMLTTEEKIIACVLSKIGGSAFVKTSTGFGPGGATAEDVALMKKVVGSELEVKASGGIRTSEDADRMIQAGATRIGASASVAIVSGKKEDKKAY